MFNKKQIAPCGLNCGVCIAYLREKNKCNGCLNEDDREAYHCSKCGIKLCEEHNNKKFTYCMECEKYPCIKIKKLNKRYSTRYCVNIFDNFDKLKEIGMLKYLKEEEKKWKCPHCGEILSMHKNACIKCGIEYRNKI